MHFGNLYTIRKWRLGAPTLKFGQFVVPFSNLTTYDVHNRIIQSLYRYSLGVRIDGGAEVEGYLPGDSESQTRGYERYGAVPPGARRHPLITGRVSHKFEQGGNAIKLGLSAADAPPTGSSSAGPSRRSSTVATRWCTSPSPTPSPDGAQPTAFFTSAVIFFSSAGVSWRDGVLGRPHVAVVEGRHVAEAEGRVARLELVGGLEQAHHLAVLGVRRHAVPRLHRRAPAPSRSTIAWMRSAMTRSGAGISAILSRHA